MFSRLRRAAAVLTAIIMILAALPAMAFGVMEYDEHDVEKLRAFFAQTDNMGNINGVIVNGSAYDPDDPSTWTRCTWTAGGKLKQLLFGYTNAVGILDLSGCEELVAITGNSCKLTGVSVANCPKLSTLEVDHNRITDLDITGCPELSILFVGSNKITELDVTNNPLLTKISCNENKLTSLDPTRCPELYYIDCGDNQLSELDVTQCPILEELYCKNNLLTELDLSQCGLLYRLRTLGNRLRTLDISVMNGGIEYVISARGMGTIGTKCNLSASGTHTVATAKADSGSAFLGWYLNGELVSSATDFECTFGEAAQLVAQFTMPSHSLTVDYVYEDGSEAAPSYTAELEEGQEYSVLSPVIDGYTADIELVSGVMGGEAIHITVTYSRVILKHLLTVSYVFEDGSEAAPSYTAELEEGQEYSVPSPVIDGYAPDNEIVSGVMGGEDIIVTVTYSASAQPVLMGDVDGSGVVNSNDALLLLRYCLGLVQPTEQIMLAGDIDGNGAVNSNDALYIMRLSLGLIHR